MSEHVKVVVDDGVMTLTLARADKKNALTDSMYGVLADALQQAQTDPAVRAVLICGEGESFCAGNDIADFAAVASGAVTGPRQVFRFLEMLAKADKPLVAAVQGRAVGIGTTMLLHCDLVYVAEDAKLTTPFVDLALAPEAASSLLLPQRVGHARAFAMFALGQAMSGAEAVAAGLANACLPGGEVLGAARAAAAALAERPLGSLTATKRLMRDADAIGALMQKEGDLFNERLKSPEAREAMMAFMQRRKPDFRNVG